MGLLIGVGDTRPAMPYDYYYGVRRTKGLASPNLTRVGRAELHRTLPVQSGMRRCLLRDDGTVAAYLHPADSTKTADGQPADLTGAGGQVMVEIPAHYRKFEETDGFWTALLSTEPLPGFHRVPLMYVGAYEAAVDRTDGSKQKLCSVVNTSAAFRGGDNDSEYDGYKAWDITLLGRPASDMGLDTFRSLARNRGRAGRGGSGWNVITYEARKALYWLYTVEYASLNSQKPYNAQPDANGYRQGGLGDGATDWGINSGQWEGSDATWDEVNGGRPFIPCGITNTLGNATGTARLVCSGTQLVNDFHVPSYRGVENIFGHLWEWTDGVNVVAAPKSGGDGRSKAYTTEDPGSFGMFGNVFRHIGDIPRADGFIKEVHFGPCGDILPSVCADADSSTFHCDYHHTSTGGGAEQSHGVLFGGNATYGAHAGLTCADTGNVTSAHFKDVGSRLCFHPE